MSNIKISKSLVLSVKTAFLCAVAIVLSILESMLPDFPFILPGMKLGLANISTLVAIEILPFPLVLCVAVVKALFALITRGATAFFMSLAGSLLSAVIMFCLAKNKKIPFGCFGISAAGALAHNLGQIFVAFFIAGQAVLWYVPVLSVSALFTGAVTGLVYFVVIPAIKRIPLLS